MRRRQDRRLSNLLVYAVLVQGISGVSVQAEPALVRGAVPSKVSDLLNAGATAARDLGARPPAWNWTGAAYRLGQVTPSPGEPVPAAAAPEPADEGDVLDEVSVTATRRPTRQRDTTATTYVVRKEDFRATGATALTDGLALVPGFQSVPSLGGVRINGIFLRGFDDSRFQVLRDGLLINRTSNGRSDLTSFQAEDLERVEVVTGGATLRYGNGAVGGVINLITETPKGPGKLTLGYEGGSYGFSRYRAKFGGGDDTFSYNFSYVGLAAFNTYPYSYTLPNQAVFYGPTVNPNATAPPAIRPAGYPNRRNSFLIGGAAAGDPGNNGNTDLYGFLKPDVGAPVEVKGVFNIGLANNDNYSAKLAFRPDPTNRITLQLFHQKRLFTQTGGSSLTSFSVCRGGPSGTQVVNPVLGGNQFFPVVPDNSAPGGARILPCDQQRYLVSSPSSTQASGPYPYNVSLDGQVFPTGNSYPFVEQATGAAPIAFQQINTSQIDVALRWDYDITPTTSLNSYVSYNSLKGNQFTPTPYFYNTNIQQALGTAVIPGPPGQRVAPAPGQPSFDNTRFEIQTALNTQISPGQNLSFGANFTEERSAQIRTGGTTFFDANIARYSFFLIDDISFGPELKANLGLRYTSNSAFGELVVPAAGVRYNLNSLISFRANWSQVFNAPNLTNLNVSTGATIANPNLKPETGVTYDVGFDLTPVRNVGLRFTYFNTYLNGAIESITFRNPDPNGQFPLLSQTQNLSSRLASGIEFTGDWQINDQFSARVSWTNTDARPYGLSDDASQSSFPYFYGYQDPNIPFNSVVFNLLYQNRGLLASLVGRYDGGKRRFNSLDLVPTWFTLDATVELPVTQNITLTGSVFNIFDTQYEFRDGNPASGTTFRVGTRLEI